MNGSEITLAVLAGGKGTRMGRPKSLLQLGGRPILEYLLDRWQWAGPKILVTSPGLEHPPAWERFDREVVDEVADQGPLRGVLTALENSKSLITLAVTVDMPHISGEQLQWLAQMSRGRQDLVGMMCRRGDHGTASIEPFPSIFSAAAAQQLRQRLAAGQLSVMKLLDDPGFAAVDAPSGWDRRTWLNLNRIEDLRAFAGESTSTETP